jgi:hypothetical protein
MRTNLFFTIVPRSRTKPILFLTFFFLALSCGAFSQVTTQGTDFYLTFGRNSGTGSNGLTFQLKIGTTQTTNVTLTFQADGSTDNFTINAGEVYTYNLTNAQKANVFSNAIGVSDKSLRIQSTAPVSVYALNQQSTSTDATNVLPVSNLGTDYYHVSYKGYNTYPDAYTVIATEDNTKIYENGDSVAILNVGQVYSNYNFAGSDATGKHITSTYPIAYFVTNACAQVPVGTSHCDCLYQQMVPVNAWGNNFLVPVTRRGKERVRVVASQNNTTVTQTGGAKKTDGGGGAQNPANENSFTLNAGEYAEFEIQLTDGGCFISADKPIAVASYLISIQYASLPVSKGDPALAWVPPIEQKIAGTTIAPFISTGTTVLNEHHALIVTETTTRDQTKVSVSNGALVDLSGGAWTTGNGTTGSDYSFYSMELTNNASYYFYNPKGLTAMGYGLGEAESYYYLSGASARNLDAAFYINNVHHQDIDGTPFCGGQQTFAFRAAIQYALSTMAGYLKWYINGVEETAARDDEEWEKTLAPGAYLIEMKVLDMSNQTHTISATLTVSPPPEAITVNAINDGVGCINTEIPATVFTSPTSGVTFTWTNDNPSLGLPASGTGNQPAFTALQTGSATITVTPHLGNCTGTSRTYTLRVSSCVLPVNPHLMGRYRGSGL